MLAAGTRHLRTLPLSCRLAIADCEPCAGRLACRPEQMSEKCGQTAPIAHASRRTLSKERRRLSRPISKRRVLIGSPSKCDPNLNLKLCVCAPQKTGIGTAAHSDKTLNCTCTRSTQFFGVTKTSSGTQGIEDYNRRRPPGSAVDNNCS